MWISKYVTNNSEKIPMANKGKITNSNARCITASGTNQYSNIRPITPYGYYVCIPKGTETVILPLNSQNVSIGVLSDGANLAQGEVMLMSSGGAKLVLKNDGKVYINGKVVG